MVAAKQHSLDKGTNAAGAYQWALKSAWDSLDSEEQLEWEAQAEDECGDVELYDFNLYILVLPLILRTETKKNLTRICSWPCAVYARTAF